MGGNVAYRPVPQAPALIAPASGQVVATGISPILFTGETAVGFTPDSGFVLTGTIGHGLPVTLTRAAGGFGAGPAIILDDRVSNKYFGLSEGQTIPVGGANPFTANTPLETPNAVKYSALNLRHSNQTANYKFTNRGSMEWPTIFGDNGPPNGQDVIYVRFWLRRNTTGSAGGSQSNKIIRVWDDSEGNGTRISHGTENLTVSNQQGLNNTSGFERFPVVGAWELHELFVGNNEVRSYVNGAAFGSYTGSYRDSNFTNIGINVKLIGYDTGGQDPMSATWQMGDAYIADSRARVMIATASSWASVTSAQEIQIPSVLWSDTSIPFTMLFGQYGSSLAGKYLYVLLANNTAIRAGQFT